MSEEASRPPDGGRPLFSVVIPTWNRLECLRVAVASVLAQTFPDFELIVVDDGSTDGTEAFVRALGDARVRYRRQERRERSAARNAGAAMAGGARLVFLDCDDSVVPHWLASLAEAVRSSPDAQVICCGARYVGHLEATRLPGPLGKAFGDAHGLFLAGTYAMRRELFLSLGGFAADAEPNENFELALRILERIWPSEVIVVPAALVIVTARQPEERSRTYAAALMRSATWILARHADVLGRDPALVADFCAVAGVAAMRLCRVEDGRVAFGRAARTRPWSLRHQLRLLVSHVPPLARRVWAPAPQSATGSLEQ